MSTNWQEIFHNYLLKVENDTRTTLQTINDDVGSTFSQELKNNLLDLTNARISLVYKEFSLLNTSETTLNDTVKACDDDNGGPKIMIDSSEKPTENPKIDNRMTNASSSRDDSKPNAFTTTTSSEPTHAFGKSPPPQQQQQKEEQKQQRKSTNSLFGCLALEAPPETSIFDPSSTSKGSDVHQSTEVGIQAKQGSPTLTFNAGFGTFGHAKTSSFVWPQTTNAIGTAIATFQPRNDTDTIMTNGHVITINTRQYCISEMKEYYGKSLDELRLEDYSANRKGRLAGGV